jgi:hypothetical protein
MDTFFRLANRLARAIGLTHGDELPTAETRKTPTVRTVHSRPNSLIERFFLFFSFPDRKPASQPGASMPSYKPPSPPAPSVLPLYAIRGNSEELRLYLQKNNFSRIDFASKDFKESPLTVAARGGRVHVVNTLLPYADPEHAGDSLRALACLPYNIRNNQLVTESGKALAKHLRDNKTYIDTLRMSKEVTFTPEQMAWLEEMRGAGTPRAHRLPG